MAYNGNISSKRRHRADAEAEVLMIQGQEFPVLTRSRRVSPEILKILNGVDTAAGKPSRVSVRLLTELDDVTLRTFPEVLEQALGPNNPEFVKALHRLAVLYHSRDNLEKAEFLYRRALHAAEGAFDKPDVEVGLLMNNLGRLLYEQKELVEAERIYLRGLETLTEALGPEHPKLSTPLLNIAKLYEDQNRIGQAKELNRRAIANLEKAFGPNHRKVIKAKNSFARLDSIG